MALFLLRGALIVLATTIPLLYIFPLQEPEKLNLYQLFLTFAISVTIAAGIIGIDVATKRKKLAVLSGVFVGLIAGLIVAFAAGLVVDLVGLLLPPGWGMTPDGTSDLLNGIKVLIGVFTCYWCISLVLQTKGDFRFVLPYIEFAKQVRGPSSVVLDTSVIIDGRICDVIDTKVIQTSLVVPRFILDELQMIADSSDKLRRARGRRGLEVLQKLQDNPAVEVTIHDIDAEGGTVDQKLVSAAMEMRARVMTNDYNLNKICALRGVEVINLNDMAKALRPVALPGEEMIVKIVKPGESLSQGVGYLEDGTMVVVENARRLIGHAVNLTVTSTLQTSAGRMIFGRYESDAEDVPSRHEAAHEEARANQS